jgi:hypothetical protein
VLVQTSQSHNLIQEPYGLALLSGKDGSVLWRETLVPESKTAGPKGDLYPQTLLSNGQLAVMSLRRSTAATVADVQLIAVDARTGRRLWTRSGIGLATIAPGAVIVGEWPASTPLESTTSGATVAVLDARTGQTRWSLRSMPDATVAGAIGGLLLVRQLQGGILKAPILLDLADGRELDRMPEQTGTCTGDHSTLIACENAAEPGGFRLLTVRSDERRVRVAGRRPPDAGIDLVKDGRIYLSGVNSPGTEIDRSGTPLVSVLPSGILTALSDHYAIFNDSKSQQYQIYRVG